MRFTSTRDATLRVTLDQALRAGLAPDGGLFVPESLPRIDAGSIPNGAPLPECAIPVLAPYFQGSALESRLDDICRETLNPPAPVIPLDEDARLWSLELFHGPTAAFKDFAARFLAGCLAALEPPGAPTRTVLVATSGDTGAAVAAAFHRRPGFRVVILYPDGRVAARQAHQLGAFGDNVQTYRVTGDFDDCQRMVKALLSSAGDADRFGLTSANSISIGRLMPQITYYARAALQLNDDGPVDVVVPTGNLGNALACVLAREMGLPIGDIHLATNANRTLPEFFAGGDYRGRPGLKTLANAMDVGDPSNFERLMWLFATQRDDTDPRAAGITAAGFDDARIRDGIRRAWSKLGKAVCPHTACALEYARDLRAAGNRRSLLVVETAHPAKFETVVEPLIGEAVPVPAPLAELLRRPSHAEKLEPDADALREVLAASRADAPA